MNLEKIDTSTTAGKAEVMRLAAEGRRVAYRLSKRRSLMTGIPQAWEVATAPTWNWVTREYAIIAEPVGPESIEKRARELLAVELEMDGNHSAAHAIRAGEATYGMKLLLASVRAIEAALTPPVGYRLVNARAMAEVALSDDGYKIGLLGPLRAHRLPLGTKLYAAEVP
ncbi:hypothetical protein [Stenotrophomonas maltophilia]|uniref:hypothetical protein n=1 Tax=Stenotrophomonas maltophilia TaxID=40324 RepID=UPI001F181566|nr:hypothetical protein [Stenotrophomonas maltophilia]MCF3455396.1 hypothetical protein [Stenotrophomonas maltophilia]MCF3540837.1 hypothetical protein [Stenotrophomonas maltophilia]